MNDRIWYFTKVFLLFLLILLVACGKEEYAQTPEEEVDERTITTETVPEDSQGELSSRPSPVPTNRTTPENIPLPTPSVSPTPTEEPVLAIAKGVNAIRECPESLCDNLGLIYEGETVEIIARNEDSDVPWIQARINEIEGWIKLNSESLNYSEDRWNRLSIGNYIIPIFEVFIHPNLEDAKQEGFNLLAGHQPLTVDFSGDVLGGVGEIRYEWDFDNDGTIDDISMNPDPIVFDNIGVFTTTLTIRDEIEQMETQIQRIVVFEQPIGFPAEEAIMPSTGVNLSYPPVEGFNRVKKQARYYIDNVDGDIAIRFYYDNYPGNLAGYIEIMDSIPENGHVIIIAPNPPSTNAEIERLYEFILTYKDKIAFVEAGNEPNLFGPFIAEQILDAIKADYIATKLADPSIPVAFPSMTEPAGWVPVDPLRLTHDIFKINGAEVCNYFDWVAVHAYPMENDIYKVITIVDTYINIVAEYCGYSPPIVVTEMGFPLGGNDEYNAHHYSRMFEQAISHPNVIYAGYHDWEFNTGENYVNITEAIIKAMNFALSISDINQ